MFKELFAFVRKAVVDEYTTMENEVVVPCKLVSPEVYQKTNPSGRTYQGGGLELTPASEPPSFPLPPRFSTSRPAWQV